MIDLENIEKRESYQIPENYFEELPGRVMQNIHQEQRKKRNIFAAAIAAVAVLVLAVGVFFTYNTPKESADIAQALQTVVATSEEDEIIETVATDYYSEELAMMDYYEYAY